MQWPCACLPWSRWDLYQHRRIFPLWLRWRIHPHGQCLREKAVASWVPPNVNHGHLQIHEQKICSKETKLNSSFLPPFCRFWGERSIWGYPGWWGGDTEADVFWGGPLCSGNTCSKGRFGLHICVYGSIGSHGGLLAFWSRRPIVKQLCKGTLELQTFAKRTLQEMDKPMRCCLEWPWSFALFCIVWNIICAFKNVLFVKVYKLLL